MALNPIGVAIPFFFLLIGVEYAVGRARGVQVYRLNDTLTDLACGIGDRLLEVLTAGLLLIAYESLYAHARLVDLADTPWLAWGVALIGVDLGYYWYHRFSHRTHLGWATHVVHHQSEEYNLAVALRQSWFTKVYSFVFYLPLAVIGVPTGIYAASAAFNLLYQFWIHTRLVGRLGPLEWVLNTPSHHRVHHGTNPEYIDKNYAGVLIVWDRWFGTFEPERAEVVYGVLHPPRSWNAFRLNLEPIRTLFRESWRLPRVVDRLRAPFMPPGWAPEGVAAPRVDVFPAPGRGYDRAPSPRVAGYLAAQFLPAGVLVTVLLLLGDGWSHAARATAAGVVFVWLLSWPALLEAWRSGLVVEAGRIVLVAALGLGLGAAHDRPWIGALAVAYAVVSGLALAWARRGASAADARVGTPAGTGT